jgi:hypothetical protein
VIRNGVGWLVGKLLNDAASLSESVDVSSDILFIFL